MNIKTQLIPIGTKRRSGTKIAKVVFFVDHDTGNPDSTAQNNVTYFTNSANEMSASAHMFIDDKEAIMCIPCLDNTEKAWHVLYEKRKDNQLYGDDSNDIAVGLELCYFPNDKARTLKAYNNYIEIAAYLAKFHNVDPDKRSGHFELDPERKTDPNNALKYLGKTYADMKKDILSKYNEMYGTIEINTIEDACYFLKGKAFEDAAGWLVKAKANPRIADIFMAFAKGWDTIKDTQYFDIILQNVLKNMKVG